MFDIGRVFCWKERGLGRFSWALQDPARNHPPGMPVVHTCLFPTFVGTGLSWLYCMWRMEAIGRRWSLMDDRSVILSMLVCRDVNTPRVQAVGCCQDLWSQPSSSEMDDLHSLSSAACFLAWSSQLECMGKLECMDEWFGLPRSRHLSLRRSVHDAGFVCGRDRSDNPLLLWIEDTFSVGCSCLSRSTLWR